VDSRSVISHAQHERLERAIEAETEAWGDHSLVRFDTAVIQLAPMEPAEFRRRLYDPDATIDQVRDLARTLGHESGKFTDQTDEEIEKYLALFAG